MKISRAQNRIGAYFWAGPGTIRLLQTKYHSPHIDQESFLSAYNLPYLKKLKTLFGVTDAWVTFSWGFSDQTEEEDYLFLHEKLRNFKDLGISTHAYIQGFNVVSREFSSKDFFCVDHWGHSQPYSKGRSFICPNHPETKKLIEKRLLRACQENTTGIFIDNILFGFPPITVTENCTPFFGCACQYCQKKFLSEFGYQLPRFFDKQQLEEYLQFREKSVTELVKYFSQLIHDKNKQFGVNLYDPTLRNDRLYFGYELGKIEPFLDYLLIENHSLPRKGVNNTHLIPLVEKTKKPIFVVSYQEGIGYEPQYTQGQINSIFTEAKQLHFFPCLKITEYTTHNIWHCLYLDTLQTPKIEKKDFPVLEQKETKRRKMGKIEKVVWKFLQPYVIPAISDALRLKFFEKVIVPLQKIAIKRGKIIYI